MRINCVSVRGKSEREREKMHIFMPQPCTLDLCSIRFAKNKTSIRKKGHVCIQAFLDQDSCFLI